MSGMLDKLKENGVNVDFMLRMPSAFFSALMVVSVLIAIIASHDWIGFATYISILVGWMIGIFFGFRILLVRMEHIDKGKPDE